MTHLSASHLLFLARLVHFYQCFPSPSFSSLLVSFHCTLLLIFFSSLFIVSSYLDIYFDYFHYSFLLLLRSALLVRYPPPCLAVQNFFTCVTRKGGICVPTFHLSNLQVLRFLQPIFYFF